MKIKIQIIICTVMFVVLLFMHLHRYRESSNSCRLTNGESYSSIIPTLRDHCNFLFRILWNGNVYCGFKMKESPKILIFINDSFSHAIIETPRLLMCGIFKDNATGHITQVCYESYIDPCIHAKTIVRQSNQKMYTVRFSEQNIDATTSKRFDIGLTVALLFAKMIGSFHLDKDISETTFLGKLGFGCSDIAIGSDRNVVISKIGMPIYIDSISKVEYYGKYEFLNGEEQLIGVAYEEGKVVGVFSSEFLDKRVVCRCGEKEYVGEKTKNP